MISDYKVIENFCNLDDFMKEFDAVLTKKTVFSRLQLQKDEQEHKMSKSEVMTIMVLFHLKS